MSTEPPAARVTDEEALRPVLAAARSAFARFGVHRTRMEDIASEASMPRQYLYRFTAGREDLVKLALLDRLREMSDELLTKSAAMDGDVGADIVSAVVESSLVGRRDEEFTALAAALPSNLLSEVLMGTESPVHAYTKRWLHPLWERAHAAGRLREGVDEDDVVVDADRAAARCASACLQSVGVSRDEAQANAERPLPELVPAPDKAL